MGLPRYEICRCNCWRYPDAANAETITKWCKDYWGATHPYSAGGAYLNFMMNEGQDRIKASYKHNYQRLTEIKKKYDPHNFFRVNQNILPAEGNYASPKKIIDYV